MHDKNGLNIRRIVILGHSGFIGRNVEKYFRKNSPAVEIVGKSLDSMDLTRAEDAASLLGLFDESTAVIMCSGLKRNFGDSIDTFSKNTGMVVNLCKVLDKKMVRRLIYFSSAAVYGEDVENRNITEETKVQPATYYGMAKYVSERLLWKSFENMSGSSLVILRPTTIYGPGEGIVAYSPSGFARAALKNEKIVLWGDGSERRDFVFIDDAARIVHGLTFKEFTGVINIASGKSHSFREILDVVSRAMRKQISTYAKERTKAKVDHGFDIKLLVSTLQGFQFTGLEQGVNITLERESAEGWVP